MDASLASESGVQKTKLWPAPSCLAQNLPGYCHYLSVSPTSLSMPHYREPSLITFSSLLYLSFKKILLSLPLSVSLYISPFTKLILVFIASHVDPSRSFLHGLLLLLLCTASLSTKYSQCKILNQIISLSLWKPKRHAIISPLGSLSTFHIILLLQDFHSAITAILSGSPDVPSSFSLHLASAFVK